MIKYLHHFACAICKNTKANFYQPTEGVHKFLCRSCLEMLYISDQEPQGDPDFWYDKDVYFDWLNENGWKRI